jgi:hypothetical protein
MGSGSTIPGIGNLVIRWRNRLRAPATLPPEKLPPVSIEQEAGRVSELVWVLYERK